MCDTCVPHNPTAMQARALTHQLGLHLPPRAHTQQHPAPPPSSLQVLAGLLAVCQLLPLQVLWGPRGAVPGGFHSALLCRLFTAVTFGVAEPGFLLLALLATLFSVTRQVRACVGGVGVTVRRVCECVG
jgi:hypothetical protein